MKRRSYSQQVCIKRAGLALQKTGVLYANARIGIAVSGGVDSFALLKVMMIRRSILPFPVELMAIHLNPGFSQADHLHLGAWLAKNGVASHIEITDFGLRAHSEENRKNSACFYCAWLRRKRLFELCRQYRLTHLAFGHNADDSAATFMLNTFRNGRIQALRIREDFFGGSLRVIRPLLLVEKRYIRHAARNWDLPVWKNSCPSSGKTERTRMEDLLDLISSQLPDARKSLLGALGRRELKGAENFAEQDL